MSALPNLIIAGFQKCGTSSLHRYLDLHPEIAMSRLKEPDFFRLDRTWDKGLDWYRGLFDAEAAVRGEASVNYAALPISDGVAARIAETAPDARLIFCVREPIERAISNYIHMRSMGHEKRPIDEALLDLGSSYLQRSRYAHQLAPFRAAFGEDQILVIRQEDLLDERRAVLRLVFEFLGVDPDFDSPRFDELWEVSAGKGRRYALMYGISRRFGDKTFWGWVPPRARRFGEKIALGKRGAAPGAAAELEVSDEVRTQLGQILRPEYEAIEPLISRP